MTLIQHSRDPCNVIVTCRDVGVDCDFKGSGETEEELMNNLVAHAIKVRATHVKM